MNIKTILTLSLVLLSTSTLARPPWSEAIRGDWHNSKYAATLPPFCGVSQIPKYKRIDWRKKLGSDLTWSNHFCAALTKIPICRTYYGNDRKQCLIRNTEGFTYWLKHIKNPNFVLLPYIHTKYGNLLDEIGDSGAAINEYQNALKKNPKYIKAYIGLIDIYTKSGLLEEADRTVKKALKIKKRKSLIKRQKKIQALLAEKHK